MSKPANPYDEAWKGFTEQTSDHELVVIHDDGLYRHLRVQAPGTRMWSWDVTTWPGHLATSGDIADGFMFTRLTDMLDFFDRPDHLRDYYVDGAPCIDVRYWAEKLCGGRSHDVKTYDSDLFLDQVRKHLEESDELGTEAQTEHERAIDVARRVCARHKVSYQAYLLHYSLTRMTEKHPVLSYWNALNELLTPLAREYNIAITPQIRKELADPQRIRAMEIDPADNDELELFGLKIDSISPAERRAEILDDARWQAVSEGEAHTWLAENEDHVGGDTFEWDLREYDLHFLFACYAIDLTVQLYRRHTSAQPSPHTTQENTDA